MFPILIVSDLEVAEIFLSYLRHTGCPTWYRYN